VEDSSPGARTPSSVPVPGGGWYEALAAPYHVEGAGRQTSCGHPARRSLLGVAHPVLPCGAKLFVSYGGTEVLTQVVDRGVGVPGREFDLTAALAERLGLRGIRRIHWRFAERA
jgi:rare lipoprotein A (peptidoglycan hydrolase)